MSGYGYDISYSGYGGTSRGYDGRQGGGYIGAGNPRDGGGFRGRRGRGRGGGRTSGPRSTHFPLSQILAITDADKITVRVMSQVEAFQAFLSADYMSYENTAHVLEILSRVTASDLHRESVLKILQVACASRFLEQFLLNFIKKKLPHYRPQQITEDVECICQLMAHICSKLPTHICKVYEVLSALRQVPNLCQFIQRNMPELDNSMAVLFERCLRYMQSHNEAGRWTGSGRTSQRRGRPVDDDEAPPEDYTQLPIFPCESDMNWRKAVFLRANKVEGAYRDTNHYLDVQFRLLREDYIRPLREGIKDFKQSKASGGTPEKSQDVCLYYGVRIIDMVCENSLEHLVQFQMTPQLNRIRWQSSKRLIFGSLVCLSMDDFETIYYAIVTERKVCLLQKGIIQIRFEDDLEKILCLSTDATFTMAESPAFFEAYRHVLEGLQEMHDALPMSLYLVDCDPEVLPPEYLTDGPGRMDLRSLLKTDNYLSVEVTDLNSWPPLRKTMLNASQLHAVQTALTKELAIIQGPPGTGKTFVGLKITKILLENSDVWTFEGEKRPILVVCYTNHALDQFLEGILKFCPKGIMRVGGRSKSDKLEEFNLKNIRFQQRNKATLSIKNSIKDCLRRQKVQKKALMEVTSRLMATSNKNIVGAASLRAHMLPGQYEVLVSRLGFRRYQSKDTIMSWLTDGLGLVGQSEGNYFALAEEVTEQILQGGDTPVFQPLIDPSMVHSMSPSMRAKLYRFWLNRKEATLQLDFSQSKDNWIKKARRQILPDSDLQQIIGAQIYTAITDPLMQHHAQQKAFYIRAWLGVCESSSPEFVSQIIHGKDSCDDAYISPEDVANLQLEFRFQLYRFWLQKWKENLRTLIQEAKQKGQNPKHFEELEHDTKRRIMEDSLLKPYANSTVFSVITEDMLQRHDRQKNFFVKAWLGIQEFCQNPSDLERLLDQLQAGDSVEEAQLNVEEEAFHIQNLRLLDDEDNGEDWTGLDREKIQSRKHHLRTAMRDLGVQAINERVDNNSNGWTTAVNTKRHSRRLRHLLTSSKPMTKEEASRIRDLWDLSMEERVRLYLFWLEGFREKLRTQVIETTRRYDQETRQLKELRMEEDKDILAQATVIGMTTTGAARYRRVLSGVACPIVILEEAAEVLEAHVVTSLNIHCEHVILIGDHKQLRPNPTVYDLSMHYNLSISLFERLVKNHLPHATLKVQHRMRPEVANLVRHVYPALEDHETTKQRPHIRGLHQDVVLFHHEEKEKSNFETSSKSNLHEAELCVRLCRYLIQQDYPPEKITILAAYSGQVFAFKNVMRREDENVRNVLVTSVDNYQGEENDIIILSLVRNNEEGSVGFLGTDNRVCVALSRARNGLYVFGNFRILADGTRELWKKICCTAEEHGQLRKDLLLQCENHPHQITVVKKPKDFDKAPEGGCSLPCGFVLAECGHTCRLKCHGYDRDHKKYRCHKPCERVFCRKGHQCVKRCCENCGTYCMKLVLKTVPLCGHNVNMECGRNPSTWYCRMPCEAKLPCGHQCSGSCRECYDKRQHNAICKVEVEKKQPCGHCLKAPCHVQPGEQPCSQRCSFILNPCGHVCQGVCGQCSQSKVHVICKNPCNTKLACGHACTDICSTCSAKKVHATCNLPCNSPLLGCGHKCQGMCKDCSAKRVHVTCKEKCGRTLPGCTHKCQLECGVKCLPCTADSCKVKHPSTTLSPQSTYLFSIKGSGQANLASKNYTSVATVIHGSKGESTETTSPVPATPKVRQLSAKVESTTHSLCVESARQRVGLTSNNKTGTEKTLAMGSKASGTLQSLESLCRSAEVRPTTLTESRHQDLPDDTRSLSFTRSLGIAWSVDLAVIMKEVHKVLDSNGCTFEPKLMEKPSRTLYCKHGQPNTESFVHWELLVGLIKPGLSQYGMHFKVISGTTALFTNLADQIVSQLKVSVETSISSQNAQSFASASRSSGAQSADLPKYRPSQELQSDLKSSSFSIVHNLEIGKSVNYNTIMQQVHRALDVYKCTYHTIDDSVSNLLCTYGQLNAGNFVQWELLVGLIQPDLSQYGIRFKIISGTSAAFTYLAEQIVSKLKILMQQ